MAVSSFARVFPTFECRSDPDLSGNPNPEKQSSSRFSTSLRRSGGFSSLIFRFPPNFVRQLSVKSRRNCSNIGVAQVVAACWSNPGAVPVTNSATFVDSAVDVSVTGGVLGGSSNSSNGVQLSDSADSKAPIFSLDGSISVHAGERFGRGIVTDAITTPVVNTSAYMFKNTAELIAYKEGTYKSYEYGRYGNPTTEVLEQKISALEGAESTLFMASGMNASTILLMALVPAGGHLVTTTDCYRRTRTFIQTFLPKMGISTSVIDPADVDGLKSALNQHRVSLFFTESPTNLYLRCVDIELVSKLCRSKGALLCVDGTFATPINQKALALGADIVLHSATKFITGHNDVIAGYISGSKKVISAVRDLHHVLGGVLNPVHGTIVGASYLRTWNCKDDGNKDWIEFRNVGGLSIVGDGMINGHGKIWWDMKYKKMKDICEDAPTAIVVKGCTKIHISGLNFVDNPRVHLVIERSTEVVISNLFIRAPGDSPNTDGIHIQASQDVSIYDSFIGTGDDCISIGSGSSNINISTIACGPGHGISIGSLGSGGSEARVENIYVGNVLLAGTTNGVRIKTWQVNSYVYLLIDSTSKDNHSQISNFHFIEDLIFLSIMREI